MPDCLDFLLLSHDGLGHALSEVKHEDPALTLLTRLVRSARLRCTKHGSPCHRPRSIRITLPGTGGSTSARRAMDTLLFHMFPRRLPEVGSVLTAAPPPPSSSKMVCSSTSFSKFGNISCAPSLEHVAGLSVLCRLLGAVGTSTVLTPVPSQANHSSHGHIERLKCDPRHALLSKTRYSSGATLSSLWVM